MLQASYSDLTNEHNRVIKILYPTASDKTTVMGLRVLAANLHLSIDGHITEKSVQTIMDHIVRPEISRIRTIQNQSEKERANIKDYNEGGQRFLFFPEINSIPSVFDGKGKLHPDIEGPEMTALLKEKIEEYFENLVDKKLANWKKNGIIGGEKRYLNADFMNIKVASEEGSITQKNPLSAVDTKHRVRGAAADMVFQYLIGNAEIAMTFTGDPAL